MEEHQCRQTSLVNRPTVSRGRVQVDLRVFPQIQAKWQCGLNHSALFSCIYDDGYNVPC